MKKTDSINIIHQKILRRLLHLRLQPIRVFCFHQVSETFDEQTMLQEDWLPIDVFKQEVKKMRKEGYVFISLPKAYEKLTHDTFRFRKYAVLTADDGWASLRNILPWLNNQQIPVTLFLNPAYLDGKHFRERDTEQYLTWCEVKTLREHYPLLTIGSHGWDHTEATKLSIEEFSLLTSDSIASLKELPGFIPFYAFPYGKYSSKHINAIRQLGLVPILVGGNTNSNYARGVIDREVLG